MNFAQLKEEKNVITLSDDEITRLWTLIDLGMAYRWPVRDKAEQKLAEITSKVNGKAERDELTDALGPMLGSDRRHEVACWIIRDWEGIRRIQNDTVAAMLNEFDDYSDKSVEAFVTNHCCNRVSSWSKLLAFRDGAKWAIYDSRTAVALNAALIAIGRSPSFEMPFSRNTKISPRRREIAAQQTRKSLLGYKEYIALLSSLRDYRGLTSVGEVEMKLFANAEAICSKHDGKVASSTKSGDLQTQPMT